MNKIQFKEVEFEELKKDIDVEIELVGELLKKIEENISNYESDSVIDTLRERNQECKEAWDVLISSWSFVATEVAKGYKKLIEAGSEGIELVAKHFNKLF